MIETLEGIWAVEIKASHRIEPADIKGLYSFAEDFPKAQCVCVGNTDHAYQTGKFRVIPWQDLFGLKYLNILHKGI